MKLAFLVITFFKIGLFSVGGGLATLPFLFELADNAANEGAWLTREMVGDMLAVAQSLPGAIGANLAAYVGFRHSSIAGAYVSAVSLTVPSIIMITFIARMLQAFKENTGVRNFFAGLRPAATALISAAGLGAIALSLWNAAAPTWYEYLRWKETLFFIVIFFLVYKLKKHPIVYIAAAGVIGVALKL